MSTELLLLENPSYQALWTLVRAYHSLVAVLQKFLEDNGITGAQFGVLRCLSDAGDEGLMLSEVSKRLLVTCGNTTGVVDRLEQAGYLRRVRPSGDRRVVLAQLTPEGKALFRRLMPEYLSLVRELLSGLTTEEQELIAGYCQRIHETAEARRQTDLPEPEPSLARRGAAAE
jgi:MarR family transcriptional regulator, 2-MHQ and catechol-resistance regulon repressor